MDDNKKLTFIGHLTELRGCFIKCVIAIAVMSIFSFIFAGRLFDILLAPAQGVNFVYIEMTEMIGIYVKVCLTAGFILAMPYLFYQAIRYLVPALTTQERKSVFIILPWIALMFIGGMAFSYFIFLPPAIKVLTTFGSEIASPQIRIGSYISMVIRLMLAAGLIFELPVISTFLARIGIISSRWLAGKRKFAFIAALIIGAIITPTADPVNQILVALPLVALYELSIWLAKIVQKKRASAGLVLDPH